MATRPGEIITFYSYKGGTGRSMALANVACLLANSGHKVVAIDWDLEAPGLHRFFPPASSSLAGSTFDYDTHEGLIDIFQEVVHLLLTGNTERASEAQFDLNQINDLLIGRIIPTEIQNLYLLKAGRFDANYGQRVNQFDWRWLFENCRQIFTNLAEWLALEYDYVLIDSRTGVTDIGGICTMLMPVKLVAVFTPNQQSVLGGLEFMKSALRYRRGSDDLRTLTIFPLPTRVEASETELRQLYRFGAADSHVSGYQPLFEEFFRSTYPESNPDLNDYFDEVQIQQHPFYAYGEVIAVLREKESDRFSLAQSYRRFMEILTSMNVPWRYRRSH